MRCRVRDHVCVLLHLSPKRFQLLQHRTLTGREQFRHRGSACVKSLPPRIARVTMIGIRDRERVPRAVRPILKHLLQAHVLRTAYRDGFTACRMNVKVVRLSCWSTSLKSAR